MYFALETQSTTGLKPTARVAVLHLTPFIEYNSQSMRLSENINSTLKIIDCATNNHYLSTDRVVKLLSLSSLSAMVLFISSGWMHHFDRLTDVQRLCIISMCMTMKLFQICWWQQFNVSLQVISALLQIFRVLHIQFPELENWKLHRAAS